MPNRRRTPAAASNLSPNPPISGYSGEMASPHTLYGSGFCRSCGSPAYIIGKSPATSHQPSLPGASYIAAQEKRQQFLSNRCFHHFVAIHSFSISLDCSSSAISEGTPPQNQTPYLGSRPRDTCTKRKGVTKLAILRYLRTEQLEHTQDPYASSPRRLLSS